jgi:hypothetical protein
MTRSIRCSTAGSNLGCAAAGRPGALGLGAARVALGLGAAGVALGTVVAHDAPITQQSKRSAFADRRIFVTAIRLTSMYRGRSAAGLIIASIVHRR